MEIDILIGCEESGIVTREFRKRGLNAWSCDLLPTSGDLPQYHIQDDVLKVIEEHPEIKMGIFFPPCTHLAVSGARHFEQKRKDGRQQEGIDFFMAMINAPIERTAVENPVGIMSSIYREPDQIIQPYYFGDPFQKTTCLWLKNLPPLYHNAEPNLFDDKITHTDKGEFVTFKSGRRMSKWFATSFGDGNKRSKTFPGIAKAMAEQWSNL